MLINIARKDKIIDINISSKINKNLIKCKKIKIVISRLCNSHI